MSSMTAAHKPPPTSARQRLLDAAALLFRRDGIRAIGIDTVLAEAGVCKASLYRAFASKDELVAAFLVDTDTRYWQWFDRLMARHPDAPRQQVRDLFAAVAEFTTRPDFRGCPFINTAVEFREPSHPGRAVAVAHKREMRRRLEELCDRLGAADPAGLAGRLHLLMEGAYSAGNTLGASGPAALVAEAAEAMVEAALGGVRKALTPELA